MHLKALALTLCLLAATAARAAPPISRDDTPRTAVITAFAPEIVALRTAMTDKHETVVSGTTFITGSLEGKPVVLFLSGVSMVNAAMNTQRALDRFHVSRIVFSGIAGGVDPSLDVGDVVVPDQWGEYLESVMAREDTPGHFASTYRDPIVGANFGMIFPKVVEVTGPGGKLEERAWFPADPALVALARRIAPDAVLKRCSASGKCLEKPPKVVVGGNGVSGQSFVDNAALRAWAFSTFQARVLDMETAAVGQVAYANGVPFVGFRSLSDLAGGDPGRNQANIFFGLASDNSAAVVRAFIKALP
ncbi:5'-methylthioadenosine/S-adenosylhomocysteine nucleosidase [Phenylobacterium sp.]|uniref:5'-methylthioadenosine/S-adenosylhomocysteine nucleosidase n=1 Tax=Phenylobacterium sp. TaxID=1871053 RepID=UPI00374DEE56